MRNATSTVLQAVASRIRDQAKRFNPALESAPVAILWTDEKREWEAVLPKIKEVLPELYSLGAYASEDRSGPGVWLRMVADGTAGKVGAGETAILYLPGVGNGQLRTDLRNLKNDPHLAPLAELQYRGTFWRQENGKDWTLRAFCETKRGGLGVKVSGSQETAQALKAAMGKLLMQNLAALESLVIDERYLNDLINPAPDETVLRWLTAPEAIRQEQGASWDSFVASAQKRYGVDLGKGPVDVAQRILASKPGDATYPLWEKYAAHWHSYRDVYGVFATIAPPDLFQSADRYPRENDADEKRLGADLIHAASLQPAAAAQAVQDLEGKHGHRRATLWAAQGHAPLAVALAELAVIAKAAMAPMSGGNVLDAARAYAESGWRIDAAARSAMAIAQTADLEKPIYAVLEALYRRWLEKQAEGFQALVKKDGYPHWALPEVPDGTVVLFVDGLRFDLARELEVLLGKDNGLSVGLEPGLTSVPSVTSSGKVWVSPASKLAEGAKGSGGGRLRTDLAQRRLHGGQAAQGNGGRGLRHRRYREPELCLWQRLGGVSRRHRQRWAQQGAEAGAGRTGPPRRPGEDGTSSAECGLERGLDRHRPRLAAITRWFAEGGIASQADRNQVGPLRHSEGRVGGPRLAGLALEFRQGDSCSAGAGNFCVFEWTRVRPRGTQSPGVGRAVREGQAQRSRCWTTEGDLGDVEQQEDDLLRDGKRRAGAVCERDTTGEHFRGR